MFGGHFYHGSLSQYINMVVDLFSRIKIRRKLRDGSYKYVTVPIFYSNKEKYIRLLTEANKPVQNETDRKLPRVNQILPALTVSLIDVDTMPTFKTNIHNNIRRKGKSLYNPVPYKFMFEILIHARYTDDVHQIMEQIMPYFQPHFNLQIRELFEDDIHFDRSIQVELTSIIPDEDGSGDVTQIRRNEWSLNISFIGWIYPPSFGTSGLIKTIYLDFDAQSRSIDDSNIETISIEVAPKDTETKEDWEGDIDETWTPIDFVKGEEHERK